jgi:hypothetical protein
MRFPYPSREPTPSEYAVLVVFVAVVLIIIGLVALAMGLHAPPEKHEVAIELEYRGLWFLGTGIAIAFAYWVFRRFRDY